MKLGLILKSLIIKIPKEFLETYPNSEFKPIHNNNYWDFVL